MKTPLKILLGFAGAIAAGLILNALLTPIMDRWGATDTEIEATFPGHELVPEPVSFVNRAITINAAPEFIYPWIAQLGADKGGWYSLTWLEGLMNCPMENANRIHPEWQNLQVGDLVLMCASEPAPPPYVVAQLHPNQAIVLGHQEDGEWVDLYQFVILPQPDGSSRLILRTRTMAAGGIWALLHPGIFIMEQGLLNGVKTRAEALAHNPQAQPTPTPEVFNPLEPQPTPPAGSLPLTCQITDLNIHINEAAGYCFAYPLDFTLETAEVSRVVVQGAAIGEGVEPVRATFQVEQSAADRTKTLQEQAQAYLSEFSAADTQSMKQQQIMVAGEVGLMVEPVPAQLAWRIIFVQHGETLYRLMYSPVDVPEARVDLETLTQTTFNSFAFIEQ